ncbi:MAG: FG-GAP-like repeat-containing protein, partial [Isosphaeraceae bacterium]
MRARWRLAAVLTVCLAIAAGGAVWLGGPGMNRSSGGSPTTLLEREVHPNLIWFADPNAREGGIGEPRVYVDRRTIDDAVGSLNPYSDMIKDPTSLGELRDALRLRENREMVSLHTRFDRLNLGSSPTPEQAMQAIPLVRSIAYSCMRDGSFDEAARWLETGLELSRMKEFPPNIRTEFHALLGINALRRGEIENCIECAGPSSCILPIAAEAVHHRKDGSREAIRQFTECLKAEPGDLRIRWLLNVAYMTLGQYPDGVPREFLVPMDGYQSKLAVSPFENVASRVGLTTRGPNLAGGSILDDFNGDGLVDVFATSIDCDRGASLFLNTGNGTFVDHSASAGLDLQIYALNAVRADFDNDGDLDVLLLRGAWDVPAPLSLLRNRGDGTFDDVTRASGLAEPTSSESAAWGDYDNDGWLDLFLCGEFHSKDPDPAARKLVKTGRCRLYHNERNGTFKDVAASAGVTDERVAKGSAWGDYDGDGRLDLFVSNMRQDCRLYHNEGDGTFKDVAHELGVTGGPASFSCWFWDYDNDGRLDLFVNDYNGALADVIAHYLGHDVPAAGHPHLYRNMGPSGFRDVSKDVGLDWTITAMGANFGDIDNDGYLDAYFGTGRMTFSELVPNVMLKNVEGRRFEDVTESSRTGHLQKGHGVSFANWDNDGDLDLFAVMGGAFPGDRASNVLFQNPGHGGHWLNVKL